MYIAQEAYLVYILNEMAGQTAIVFCATCASTMKTALMLRQLGFGAVPLHGQMSQVGASSYLFQENSYGKAEGSLLESHIIRQMFDVVRQ